VLANVLRQTLLQHALSAPVAAGGQSGAVRQAASQSAMVPELPEDQPANDNHSTPGLPEVAMPAPAAGKLPQRLGSAEATAEVQPEALQHAAEQAEQSAADGRCVQTAQTPAGIAAHGTANAGVDSATPLRRRSNRIAARQAQQEAHTDVDRGTDEIGPSQEMTGKAGYRSSSRPPQPPPSRGVADEYSTAALRLAFAMSVLLFTALLLPVVAPQASEHISKVHALTMLFAC
jgi:hypothetical protein